jgi:hypothetical protein
MASSSTIRSRKFFERLPLDRGGSTMRKSKTNGDSEDLLFSSGEENEVKALDELLRSSSRTNIVVVRQAPLLRDVVTLPFIDTADGLHISGLEAIENYLKNAS